MHKGRHSWTQLCNRWHFEILANIGNSDITWQFWIAAAAARATDTMIYAFYTRVDHMSCLMEALVFTFLRPRSQLTGLKTDILQYLGPLPSSDIIPIIQIVVKRG